MSRTRARRKGTIAGFERRGRREEVVGRGQDPGTVVEGLRGEAALELAGEVLEVGRVRR